MSGGGGDIVGSCSLGMLCEERDFWLPSFTLNDLELASL